MKRQKAWFVASFDSAIRYVSVRWFLSLWSCRNAMINCFTCTK
jgi:hypothetical protein